MTREHRFHGLVHASQINIRMISGEFREPPAFRWCGTQKEMLEGYTNTATVFTETFHYQACLRPRGSMVTSV